MVDGVKCGPDGVRCDVSGHVWISSNAGRNVGYSGVTVWTPDGKLIGRIRLPEICGNICFGGPKRNRLFMAGEPVALRRLHPDPGCCAGLIRKTAAIRFLTTPALLRQRGRFPIGPCTCVGLRAAFSRPAILPGESRAQAWRSGGSHV